MKFLIRALEIIFAVWLVVSFLDVVAHNLEAQPQYLPFNFFVVVFG